MRDFNVGFNRAVGAPRAMPMPPKDFGSLGAGATNIASDVAQLRAEMESLIADFGEKYGEENPITLRAEQVSGALQRLEWALERHQQKPQEPAATGASIRSPKG